MNRHLAALVMAIVVATCGPATAALVYDFETGTDGFGPNGLFPPTQDTIGATSGSGSLRIDVPELVTFAGALNGSFIPAPIGDPPGVESIIFDLTIVDQFAGAFADVFITVFGATQPDFVPAQLFGLQAEFNSSFSSLAVAPGTYEIKLDLDSANQNPLTFVPGESFNEIFGGFGTGPNDLIVTGFQFTVAKSGDAPLTFYIDNVRTVVPEPTAAALLAVASAIGLAARRR